MEHNKGLAEALASLGANMAAAHQDRGGDPPKEERRRRSLDADRKREGKPRPAPIPTGRQRVLAESGGSILGVRFATAVLAATDPRLRPSTSRWFLAFLWNYHPGRIYRKAATRIAAALGLSDRMCRLATAQLKRFGYLQRCEGGWISPPVELKLDPEKRAWREQLSFPFVAEWDTLGAAKYLDLVERRPVDDYGDTHTCAPQQAQVCTPTGTLVPVHPGLTPDLPLTDPAHRAECSPRPEASFQGELGFMTHPVPAITEEVRAKLSQEAAVREAARK